MPHLVVARQHESLDWIHDLPIPCSLTLFNAGEAIDVTAFDHPIDVQPVPSGTPAMACYLRFLQQASAAARSDVVVFTPGDPLAYSPAFMALLAESDRFGELQVLSAHGANDHWPPHAVRQHDRRDWIGDAPVRAERFSLLSLAPVAYQHDAALRAGKVYRRKHRLAEGVPALHHFLALAGLEALAHDAQAADLGVYAHGGLVAVRGARLVRQSRALQPQLARLAVLVSADTNYPELLERAWLHLLGLPFIRLEAMAQPAETVQQAAAPGMARVVASIDAVLAASRPIPVLKTEVARPITPMQMPLNPSAAPQHTPEPADIAVQRERIHAAFQRGDTHLAWEWIQQALQTAPRHIGLLADATQMAYAQQDTDRALHCARRALAVDPDHLECLFTLGMCLAATGQAEEALSIFERLNQEPLATQWQQEHPEMADGVALAQHHRHDHATPASSASLTAKARQAA